MHAWFGTDSIFPSYTLLLSNLKCTHRVEGYRK